MSDEPYVLVETPRFRIVQTANGNKVLEKYDGADAMGGPRWRDLKIGDADQVSRLLRDWIFEHLAKNPSCGGLDKESL